MSALQEQLVDLLDQQAIGDLLARYCWSFDEGDWEAHAAVWSGDGLLTGFGDPFKGMEAIKGVVLGTYEQSQGKWRHQLGNLLIRYADSRDQATARGYNLVTRWGPQPALHMMVLETFEVARAATGWRVTAVDLNILQ